MRRKRSDGWDNRCRETKKKRESQTNRKRKKARQIERTCMRRRRCDGWDNR